MQLFPKSEMVLIFLSDWFEKFWTKVTGSSAKHTMFVYISIEWIYFEGENQVVFPALSLFPVGVPVFCHLIK